MFVRGSVSSSLRVTVRVIAHDAKRLQIYLEMFADERAQPVAAGEQMLLHVDMSGPKAAPFDADVLAKVSELEAAHAALPPARYAGHTALR